MQQPRLRVIVQAVALAVAAVGIPAHAQSATDAAQPAAAPTAPAAPETKAAPDSAELQVVEVTARRKRENLQEVPTAVTAINAADLEDLRISGFEAVAQTVPNVVFQPQGGSPTSVQMQIRGVSNGSLNPEVDSGIGLYVDGVYFGRAGAAAFEVADLERVEVLRGPQGTLFGRNATAGAINLITAGPDGQAGGRVSVGIGNLGERTAKMTLNSPSFNGLAARVTFAHSQHDGDVTNTAPQQTFNFTGDYVNSLTTNKRGGDDISDNILFALRYTGIKGLKVDYKYDQTEDRGSMNYRQTGDLSGPGGTPNGFTYKDHLFEPLEGTFTNFVHGQSLVAEYEINDNLSTKYIFGTRRFTEEVPGDQVLGDQYTFNYPTFDRSSTGTGQIVTFGLFAARHETHDQASHELQLLGKNGPVDWILGAFQFEEAGTLNDPILLDFTGGAHPVVIGPTNPVSAASGNYFIGENLSVDNKSLAFYGHANWTVLSNWVLGAGVRRTDDKREENIIAAGALANTDKHVDSGNTDYDGTVTYKIDKDTNVYAKYATGYVSGGSLGGHVFSPEKMKAEELGFKSILDNRKFRFNAALFREHRIDAQIEYFGAAGYSMGKADSTQTGLELEGSFVASKHLTFNSSIGINHNSSSGDVRVTQPKENAYFGADYRFGEVLGAVPVLRLDMTWRPGYWTIKCPAGQTQDPGKDTCSGTVNAALDAAAKIPSETNVNARFSFEDIRLGSFATGRFSIWGRNLTDNRNLQYNFSLGATTLGNTFDRPRTFGVDFGADF